jgi:hypothetical protein
MERENQELHEENARLLAASEQQAELYKQGENDLQAARKELAFANNIIEKAERRRRVDLGKHMRELRKVKESAQGNDNAAGGEGSVTDTAKPKKKRKRLPRKKDRKPGQDYSQMPTAPTVYGSA